MKGDISARARIRDMPAARLPDAPATTTPTESTWPVTILPPPPPPRFITAQPEAGFEIELPGPAPTCPARCGLTVFARDIDLEPCVPCRAPALGPRSGTRREHAIEAPMSIPRRIQRGGDAQPQVAALLDIGDGADGGDDTA